MGVGILNGDEKGPTVAKKTSEKLTTHIWFT